MASTGSSGLPPFDRTFLAGTSAFSRIGTGEIGGKASGLRLIRDRILPRLDHDRFSGLRISVPALTVVAADVFSSFVEHNRLQSVVGDACDDDRITHAFRNAELPAEWVGDLRALVTQVHTPLAVRSSSLLEDALDHPLAGVYSTKMIPNNELDEDLRFRRLIDAVKCVYASTYMSTARDSVRTVGSDPDAERMALVVQEVVGHRAGDRFYPHVSGVGRSFNYYPAGGSSPSDGVAYLALGLGKTIVDGAPSWHFSPSRPQAPPPFNTIRALLDNTQRSFWAVHMGEPPIPDPMRETECLVSCDLALAEADGGLELLVSTYDPGSDRLYPGLDVRGARALTFAPLLRSRLVGLSELVAHLLENSREELDAEVEIEFALDFQAEVPRFGFLQVRPTAAEGDRAEVTLEEMEGGHVLVASHDTLGNGRRDDIRDVVYVKPAVFDPARTSEIAAELEMVNRELVSDGSCYLLIGFGRWGTQDSTSGIPVVWSQISGARIIVESTLAGLQPELSQGSHFFHNLLSFRVLYLSVERDQGAMIDWSWLDRQPARWEGRHLRHVRLDAPLDVRVDGAARRGVIRRHV